MKRASGGRGALREGGPDVLSTTQPLREGEWEASVSGVPRSSLPPKPAQRLDWPMCSASWRGYVCTRRAGHAGRHAAGGSTHTLAVWLNDSGAGVMMRPAHSQGVRP